MRKHFLECYEVKSISVRVCASIVQSFVGVLAWTRRDNPVFSLNKILFASFLLEYQAFLLYQNYEKVSRSNLNNSIWFLKKGIYRFLSTHKKIIFFVTNLLSKPDNFTFYHFLASWLISIVNFAQISCPCPLCITRTADFVTRRWFPDSLETESVNIMQLSMR